VRPNALARTATGVGSGFDLQGSNDAEGDSAVVILDCGCWRLRASNPTCNVKLTESDTSGGSYTDVSGGAFTTTSANTALQEKLYVNSNDMKRYIKASVTVAGGTGTGFVSLTGLASKKYGN
jgi:hypothetical protein